MAINRIHIDAPADAVFDVLCDAASYRIWVVGSKRIRGVDPDWPAVGSKFHHTVGFGPFTDSDSTIVLEMQRPSRLVLEARVWPFGTAEIAFDLVPSGGGTDVALEETPRRGPVKRLESSVLDQLIWVRNAVGLRRLRAWSEQRHHATPGVPVEPPGA
jgi:uncharacterized protein YndB with AHSA1/START domain